MIATVLAVLAFGAAGVLVWRGLPRRRRRRHGGGSYERRAAVLQPSEAAVLHRLRQLVGERGEVLAKVRAADVLTSGSEAGASQRQRQAEHLGRRRFDFIACSRDFAPRLGIVLLQDGRPSRTLESACRRAGLPLLGLQPGDAQSWTAVEAALDELLPRSATSVAAPDCPRCGRPTQLRTVQHGQYKGAPFWVCEAYPQCRGAVPHQPASLSACA